MPRTPRDVGSQLEKEGWARRKGKGDHVVFRKSGALGNISLDMGKKEIPQGTYKKIAKLAGGE